MSKNWNQKFTLANKFVLGWFQLFYEWRVKHINEKNFIIFTSVLIGVVAGFAAVILKNTVHWIQKLLKNNFDASFQNYGLLFYPLIGILLTVIYVQFFRNGKLGRGVGNILFAISKWGGRVEADKTYSHIVSSALTVGFGGSSGLEAPIVVTGSAIGSNVASLFKLKAKVRILMLACGAAAGIAAVFNTPIAGVLFAMEVLLFEFSVPYFIPLLIAAASAAVVSNLLVSEQLFVLVTKGYTVHEIPFYFLLGLFCGIISVYVTKVTLYVEGKLDKWQSVYVKAIAGGLILGLMIFFLPPLYGEGYDVIQNLMRERYMSILNNSLLYDYRTNAWIIFMFSGVILLVKILATSLTIGSGGNGGVFAPSLFIGAFAGFFFADFFRLTELKDLTMINFIVVGMAGVLSGVNHAPLTAIFLIAEITGGYSLFVPLMLVSAMSYFMSRYFVPFTVYTKKLSERGVLPSYDKDKNILSSLDIEPLIEKDFITITPMMTIEELKAIVEKSKRSIYPVLDEKERLIGILSFDAVKEVIFKPEICAKKKVYELMDVNFAVADIEDGMKEVADKFEIFNTYNLPVVDNENKYIGFLSRSTIFTRYRNALIKQSKQIENL